MADNAENIVKAILELDLSQATLDSTSKKINSAFKSGFEKSFDWNSVNKGLDKTAKGGFANIAKSINVVTLALSGVNKALQVSIDQFVKMTEQSSKFIGQGSIFTDKATMDMMQQTGQTATQAQGTQRSLDMLGLNFSDIQQGKITEEQAAIFEQLRQREIDKLEEINKVAGPTFKTMQQITLGISLLFKDVEDWITIAFMKMGNFREFVGTISKMLEPVGRLIKNLITLLAPVFDQIFAIVNGIFVLIGGVIDILNPFLEALNIDIGNSSEGRYGTPSIANSQQTTNNYNYGSTSLSYANPRTNNNDLFSNSYVLVND